MRTFSLFAMVILMSIVVLESTASAQTLPAPQAVTDPKQIKSTPNAQVEPKSLTIEKLYMTRQVGRPTWSPDGQSIAFISNMSGRNNIWTVPADGGWPVQLTISDQRQSSPAWSPDGKWIAYQSDYDGDEQWDIFLVSPKTGRVVNLTQTREIAELDPTWSPDGRYLAYEVKPKTSAAYEIDVYDMLMREVKHITTGTPQDKRNSNPIWSKDGKYIVYTQEQAKGTDSNIFIANVAAATSTLLTPHEGEQIYSADDISPDGKHVLITSNAGNGYDNVGLLDVATKKVSWLTKDKWEISGGEFSPEQVRRSTDSERSERARWRALCLYQRRFTPALLPQRAHRSGGFVGVCAGDRQVASRNAFPRGGGALGRHGRALSGALSQPRRQVDDFCFPLRAVQHGPQRTERRDRLYPRRSNRANA